MISLRLAIELIGSVCRFEWGWSSDPVPYQRLAPATLPYPETLQQAYQNWRRAYLSYYRTRILPPTSPPPASSPPFRGRVEEAGSLSPDAIDWHIRLGETEARFLKEFHYWLQSPELHPMRSQVAQTARTLANPDRDVIEVLLTCSSELAYLPWEAWKIGDEFVAPDQIRILRVPEVACSPVLRTTRRRKPRVLAIWGDDTGLNFQEDREALLTLEKLADIHSLHWHADQTIAGFKDRIRQAIRDSQGWDLLFFTGHSAETELTGGRLAVAPGLALTISDLEQDLTIARQQGLQCAIFNSCSGLRIAESLMGRVGLSQVVMMREPVHNHVAQVFLVQFLRSLVNHRDVQECLMVACRHLEQERLHYPSAYLVPSLVCHPQAPLFRIQPRWKRTLRALAPSRLQTIALLPLAVLSCLTPVQSRLLESRTLVQAMYRQATGQIPPAPPPVLLVQIDDRSITKAKLPTSQPMDRQYLAALITKLTALNASVVGLDYVLDRPQPDRNGGQNDRLLAKALRSAVDRPNPVWFVLAAAYSDQMGDWLQPSPDIADPSWLWVGHVYMPPQYLMLEGGSDLLPFSYLLALASKAHRSDLEAVPKPQVQSQQDFWSQFTESLTAQGRSYRTWFSAAAHLQPITEFAYGLGQMWFHPILDYSLPPDRVYQTIPAWQLLASPANSVILKQLPNQVVIIAAAYPEAGIFQPGADQFPMPAAVGYWLQQTDINPHRKQLTGGEDHAYAVHALLRDRLVVPIPDLWMVGLGILMGKGLGMVLTGRSRRFRWGILLIGTFAYTLLSLQLYISGAVLLPWMFPVVTVWVYRLTESQWVRSTLPRFGQQIRFSAIRGR